MKQNIDMRTFARGAVPTLTFAAGSTVFEQGDPGNCMYIVQSGVIEMMIGDKVIETVGPNGIFGELAMIDQGPRSSAAVARTDCRLVVVDQTRFMLMVRQTPFFAVTVMRILAHRLRATDERLQALSR